MSPRNRARVTRAGSLPDRCKSIALWIVPPVFCLLLYWPGFTAWFEKDDLVWLGLWNHVQSGRDFAWALFAPLAQGTVRTWSERVFFMGFWNLCGLQALPYHLWIFLTQAANLILLQLIVRKLVKSAAAGFWAAILWISNSAMAGAVCWVSNYNKILCAFFLLLSFWLLLRYVESGRPRYYRLQWVTFLLGFGALELNVIYPVWAALYAATCARPLLRKLIPLFLISAAYSLLHFTVAPAQTAGPYRMVWDASLFHTFWIYWKTALGPIRLILFHIYPSFWRSLLAVLLMAGLVGFLLFRLWRRQWLALAFAGWFLIALAPLLPLRDHFSFEYLAIPLIGLAALGGWGLASGWRSGAAGKIAATGLLLIYLAAAIPVGRLVVTNLHQQTWRIQKLIFAVREIAAPKQVVLLEHVDTDLFFAALIHQPFRLVGLDAVYLPAADRARLDPVGEHRELFLDAASGESAIVYDVAASRVKTLRAPQSGQR